jgi:UbiD family decarboxylase
VSEQELRAEAHRRLTVAIPPAKVERHEAPVQEVVLRGEDANLLKLPAHPQRGFDGGVYISASIDVSLSHDRVRRNSG